MQKKNDWTETINGKSTFPGYAIIIDGHTMFPQDVVAKLERLDYLEEKIKGRIIVEVIE